MLFSLRLSPLAIALLAAVALPAHSQNLIELYASARDYDATWQAARAQFDANVARAAQARAGILPAVGLSAGASRTNLDIDTPQGSIGRSYATQNVGVNASQPLYRPANWATWQQGQRQAEVAEAVLVAAEQDLVVRVSQAYFDVLASQDTLTLVDAQKTAVAEQLAFANRNFEVGTSTITDSREAQARYDLVVAQEIAARNDLQVKKIVLDQLVGRTGTVPTPLALPFSLSALTPADLPRWVEQAEAGHPSIRQARLGLNVAALEVKKAEAGHKPTLDAQLGYNVNNNPEGTSLAVGRSRINAASVGVVFNLPLFAGFATENRIRETLALEEQSRQILESTRRSVTQATRAAFLGLVSGAGQVRALEAAEASSQSALDANRLGYQVGVRINIDVLNSQSQLFQTKRDLAQARYNVLIGNLKLRQANGTLVPDDLRLVNATLGNVNSSGSETGAGSNPVSAQTTRQRLAPAATPETRGGVTPLPTTPAAGVNSAPLTAPSVTQPAIALPAPVMPVAPPPPVILTAPLR